jgi:hypothetical protein
MTKTVSDSISVTTNNFQLVSDTAMCPLTLPYILTLLDSQVMGPDVLTAVKMLRLVLWVVTPG